MFWAQLDTCVLVPSLTRDLLLEVAEQGVYRPLWSTAILDELDRTLRKLSRAAGVEEQITDAYVRRLLAQMETAFPDALVEGWEPFVHTIELPDPDDRHVVAAAMTGRADVIVTENRKDFPTSALPKPLFTQTADTFLLDSLDLHPSAVLTAIDRVAARSGRLGPKRSSTNIVQTLMAHGCPEFGTRAQAALRDRTS